MDQQQPAPPARRLYQHASNLVHFVFPQRRSCRADAKKWYSRFASEFAVRFHEGPAHSSAGILQRRQSSRARHFSATGKLFHGQWQPHRRIARATSRSAQSGGLLWRARFGREGVGGIGGGESHLRPIKNWKWKIANAVLDKAQSARLGRRHFPV